MAYVFIINKNTGELEEREVHEVKKRKLKNESQETLEKWYELQRKYHRLMEYRGTTKDGKPYITHVRYGFDVYQNDKGTIFVNSEDIDQARKLAAEKLGLTIEQLRYSAYMKRMRKLCTMSETLSQEES